MSAPKFSDSKPCSGQGSRPQSRNVATPTSAQSKGSTGPSSRPLSKSSQLLTLPSIGQIDQIDQRDSGRKLSGTGIHPRSRQRGSSKQVHWPELECLSESVQENLPSRASTPDLCSAGIVAGSMPDIYGHVHRGHLRSREGRDVTFKRASQLLRPAGRANRFTEDDAVAVVLKCLRDIKQDGVDLATKEIHRRLLQDGYNSEEVQELLRIGEKNAKAAEWLRMNNSLLLYADNIYRNGVPSAIPWPVPVAHPREMLANLSRNLRFLPTVTVNESDKHDCMVHMHFQSYAKSRAALQHLQEKFVGQRARAMREGRFVQINIDALKSQEEVDSMTKILRGAMLF